MGHYTPRYGLSRPNGDVVLVGCPATGKVGHPSRASAKRHVKHARRKFGDRALEAYRCRHCGNFHVGHPPSVIAVPTRSRSS